MIWWAAAAQAATVDVCSMGCDYTTIAAALANPTASTIEVGAGTYGVDDLTIDRSLSLVGDGSATTTLRADGDDIFDIADDVTNLVMSGFTWDLAVEGSGLEFDGPTNATLTDIVVNGHDTDEQGGVIDLGNATMLLEDCSFSDIVSTADGAVIAVSGGSVTVRTTTFTGVDTTGDGGIVFADGGSVAFDDVTVDDAEAAHGGVVAAIAADFDIVASTFTDVSATEHGAAFYVADGASLTGTDWSIDAGTTGGDGAVYLAADVVADLSNVAIEHSKATRGGAAWVGPGASLTCVSCTFTLNEADEVGGAIAATTGSVLELPQLVTHANSAVVAGGAVWVDGGVVDIVDGDLSEDSAGDGGALYLFESTTTLLDSAFALASALTGSGGAVACADGSLTMEGGEVSGSTADLAGGAIVSQACTLDIFGATLDDNGATDGGAVATADADVTIDDASLTLNTASGDGGALWTSGGSLTLTSSDLVQNLADDGGGGLYVRETDTRLEAVRVINNAAAGSGGGIDHENGELTVVDSWFEANVAVLTGGGLRSNRSDLTTVLRNRFCANIAADGGGASQALADGGKDHLWANNVFLGNVATAAGAGLRVSSSAVTVVHNDLLDGDATGDGGGAWTSAASGDFHSNLMAWTASGSGLEASASPALSVDWDGWWENVPSNADVALGANSVVADPLLENAFPGVACDLLSSKPLAASPLLNAGDPDYPNPDGSQGHIGSWGGPWADADWFLDADGDGAAWLIDCDDANADLSPDAPEICNSIDDDCDGLVDGLDDNLDPDSGLPVWVDLDDDGFGSSFFGYACVLPPLGAPVDGDCNDGNPDIHPDAVEVCNGDDDDCDELADDADPSLDPATTDLFHVDADADGWGGPVAVHACDLPEGASALAGDCNDDASAIFPGADEVCNDIDDDCNNLTDGADPGLVAGLPGLFEDADGDGVGGAVARACAEGDGVVSSDGDCNDDDATVHPGAVDACGNGDEDCDALVDEDGTPLEWFEDADGDGFGDASIFGCEQPEGTVVQAGDCDDGAADTYPGATDVPGDGVDQDCNGTDATGTAPTTPTDTRTVPEVDTKLPDGPEAPDAGCACDNSNGRLPALWALLALPALRRRPARE